MRFFLLFGLAAGLWQPNIAGYQDHRFRPALNGTGLSSQLDKSTGTFGFLTGKNTAPPARIAVDVLANFSQCTGWRVLDVVPTKHNGMTHVYLTQNLLGLDVVNSHANVNLSPGGRVLSVGSTGAATRTALPAAAPLSTPEQALRTLASKVGLRVNDVQVSAVSELAGTNGHAQGAHFSYRSTTHYVITSAVAEDPIPVSLVWVAESDDTVTLAWDLVVRTTDGLHWYDAAVTADGSNRVALVDDWVNFDDQYAVYQAPNLDPRGGGPDSGRAAVFSPCRTSQEASPNCWNTQSVTSFADTRGNNVYAQDNPTGGSSWVNNYRPSGGDPSKLVFQFPLDLSAEPQLYKDAAIANLFYWNNIIHDLFWLRGFDEVSGNFQETNFGRGGLEVDAVQANAQDGAGYNNANMATPPDGQRPRMRMYLWNQATPKVDGDLDSGIIVHEYGHGISQRLTGGPSRVNCLSSGQAGGMGEGWGDWWAVMLEQTQETRREEAFPMGLYAAGKGIRPYPYAWDTTVNPQTYQTLNTPGYTGVHAIGSVWATTLFSVYWYMRDHAGFDGDWYYGNRGNNHLWQNVVDGLKLQPCTPNFLDARDAIIQADQVNYDGYNVCALWCGFARRGLGTGATFVGGKTTNSPDVPENCVSSCYN